MIKVRKLLIGDKIGVISPSRYVQDDLENINKAIQHIVKLGFRVELGKYFKTKDINKYSSASALQRAEDINNLFANKEIKAIFCALGGDSANEVLPFLDYEILKRNPKPLVGYSDITHLLLAINAKTDMVTFHGPNLAIIPNLNKTSIEQMMRMLNGKEKSLLTDFEVIRSGKAEGNFIGGNLFVFNAMNKTSYMPEYKDTILFFEDLDGGLSSIRYQLNELNIAGVLGEIKGILVGHNHPETKESRKINKEVLLRLTEKYNYPIIKTSSFGHFVKEFYTFPEGIKVKMDTERKELILLESPVC